MEIEKPRRRNSKVRRFTEPRRAHYLEVLARTGNAGAAAKAVGLHRRSVEQRVKRDAAFAMAHSAAREEAARRLAGARDSSEGVDDPRFEAVKRGRGGRLQIVATRRGKWSKTSEDMFLGALRGVGNVAAAARAVGFSESLIWQRRRKWPGFAERIEEALEEADLAIEFRLAAAATGFLGVDGPSTAPGLSEGDSPSPQSPPASGRGGEAARPSAALGRSDGVLDPDLALRFLKWREAKRQGRAPNKGHGRERPPAIEDVTEKIIRQVAAIKRHKEAQRIEEGWTRAEDGYMIPPGWVREQPPE